MRRFSRQRLQGAPGDLAQEADREDQDRGDQALVAPESVHPLRAERRSCTATRSTVEHLRFRYPQSKTEVLENIDLHRRSGRAHRHHRTERHRQDHADASACGRAAAHEGHDQLGGERAGGLHAAGSAGRVREENRSLHLDVRVARRSRDDDQIVRATLGRLLFSGDETEKSVRCSPAARRAA